MPEMVRVVVIGGGYAGVMTANRLAGNRATPAMEVTLVDPGRSPPSGSAYTSSPPGPEAHLVWSGQRCCTHRCGTCRPGW